MEIERKFLVKELPDLTNVPSSLIEQSYLCESPALRVRKDGDRYILTCKGGGHIAREELNVEMTEEAYLHLREKADGCPITKRRYRIPYGEYLIELDVFEGVHAGMIVAEVEFPTLAEAESFTPPEWFGEDVSDRREYKNSYLAFHTGPNADVIL